MTLDGDDPSLVLEKGQLVGRFVILSQLGSGGMGVVYSAYDPELERSVALKFHHGHSEVLTARLLREARALGRIAHPNVVAIHDVGTHGGRVWLAMEQVEGETLEAWLAGAGGRRPWKQVLAIMQAAGRGLIAVHAANLVHRDFKPSNLMVGGEGRVWVMDLGVVRSEVEAALAESIPEGIPQLGTASASLPSTLTGTGGMVGTPAYMAPEQFRGDPVDARGDQFAFCAVMWRSLYGERPFEGESLAELRYAVLHQRRRPAPRDSDVPAWLHEIVARGLASDPDQRWPSMAALLDALASGRRRSTLQRTLIAVAGLAFATAGALGYGYWDEARRAASCEVAGARIDELWTDERRAALRQAMLATQVLDAEPTATKVLALLDRQAQSWRSARTEVCMNVEVRRSWDSQLEDRAQWCLEQRWDDLEISIVGLADPDVLTIQRAVEVAYKGVIASDAVDPCLDEARLALYPLPPTPEREPIRAVRAEITRADLLARSGNYAAGLDIAKLALAQAEELDWVPLTAFARYQVGSLSSYTGDIELAFASLTDSYFEAAQIGNSQQAATSATLLVYVLTEDLDRLSDARHWVRLAQVELLRMGAGEDGLVRASLHQNTGAVELREGNLEQAKLRMAQALELRREILGPEHPNAVLTIGSLALVHFYAEEYEQAGALYEQQLALLERTLGPDHPKLAAILDQYSLIYIMTDRREQAEVLLRRALVILERSVGPNHITVANALMNLGVVEMELGRWEEARVTLERAELLIGESHGPHSKQMGSVLINIADAQRHTGQLEQARSSYERALVIKRQASAPDELVIAGLLGELAEVAIEQGLPADAIEFAQQGVTLREAMTAPAELLAVSRFTLARARWAAADASDDADAREQAIVQAREAAQALRSKSDLPEKLVEALAEAEAWLAAQQSG